MPIWNDEQSGINQLSSQRYATQNARATASPVAAQNVTQILQDFPWLSAGVAYSLGASGTTGPAASSLAQLELNRQLTQNPTAYSSTPVAARQWTIQIGGKNITFTSRREAKQALQKYESFQNEMSGPSLLSQGISAVEKTFSGAAVGPRAPGAVTRPVAAAAQAPLDTLNASIREGLANAAQGKISLANMSKGDVEQSLSQVAQQSPLYQSVAEGKSLGTGLLPSPQSPAGVAAAQAARDYSPFLINGHAFTVGRAVAAGTNAAGQKIGVDAFSPDSTAFNILSGIVDASIALKYDPTAQALGVSSRIREANRVITPDAEASSIVRAIEGAPSEEERARLIDDVFAGRPTHTLNVAEYRTASAAERAQMLEQAGAVVGRRPVILPNSPIDLLYNNNDVNVFVNRLANEHDPATIYHLFGGTLPVDAVKNLSRATDASEVRQILAPELGTTVDRIPTWRAGANPPSRWSIQMPGRVAHFPEPGSEFYDHEMRALIDNVDGHLAIAKVPVAERLAITSKLINSTDRIGAVRAMGDAMEASLIKYGASEDTAKQLVGHLTSEYKAALDGFYGLDPETGDRASSVLLDANGVDHILVPGPRLMIDRLNSDIFMPDPRQMRRLVSNLNAFVSPETQVGRAFGGSVHLLDTGMGAWRTFAIARPALAVKTFLDQALRVAATDGSHSIFMHPIDFIRLSMGSPDDSLLARVVERLGPRDELPAARAVDMEDILSGAYKQEEYAPNLTRRLATAARRGKTNVGEIATDITGSRFETPQYQEAMLGDSLKNLAVDTRTIHLNQYEGIGRDDPKFAQALTHESVRMSKDRAVRVALETTPEEFKRQLWEEPWGRFYRNRMASGQAQGPEGDAWRLVANDRDASDQYAEVIQKAIRDHTNGDEAITEALRTGKINGHKMTDEWRQIQSDAVAEFQSLVDEGRGPDFSKIQRTFTKSLSQKEQDVKYLNNAVNTAFDALITRPSNAFFYDPTYRAAYAKEAERLIPSLSAEGRATLLDNLPGMQLPEGAEASFRAAIAQADAKGVEEGLSLGKVSQLAHTKALDTVKATLHDFSNRGQIADAARLVVPFGAAWKDIFQSWSKILMEHPEILRRAQQGIYAARESHFNPETGLPSGGSGTNTGFFRFDPQTQQEVFTVPGSELLTGAVGVPVPLKSPVQGLNMVGEGLPGIGPVVSIPAAFILSTKPGPDQIRDRIFPYGMPQGGWSNILGKSLVPSYLQKFLIGMKSPETDPQYASTVIDVARYLNSTGEYKIQGPDSANELNRLMDDARAKTSDLFLVRGAAQFFSPSAPAFDFRAKDKTGNLIAIDKMVRDYHQMSLHNSYDDALLKFIDKYGTDNLLVTQAKSKSLVKGLTSTDEQGAWAAAHPDLVKRYANTWALLAPAGTQDNISEYNLQLERGQRRTFTPKEAVLNANKHLGDLIYAQAQKKMGGPPFDAEETLQLRNLREALANEFEGFSQDVGPKATDTATAVRELTRASLDSDVAHTEAGKGLNAYLEIRAEGEAKAQSWGLSGPFKAAKAANLRAAMQQDASDIIARYPAFQRMWDQVFSREFPASEQP